MQNKFGLKDLVLLIAVGLVGLLVLLQMVQKDRNFEQVRAAQAEVSQLQGQVSRLATTIDRLNTVLESGVRVSGAPGGSRGGNQAGGDQAGGAAGEVELADWMRDDRSAFVAFFPVPDYATDPISVEGYQEGGSFTETFEAQMPKVMPYISQDVYSRRICDVVFETLADYNAQTQELNGVLAEAWQYDRDGLWLRVKIHDNARFSDGEPVKASDVVFTFNRIIRNPQIEAERARSIVTSVKDVTAISEKVVEFTFEEALFSNLSQAMNNYVLPEHFYSQFTARQLNEATDLLLGSGPFRTRAASVDNQWTPGSGDYVIVRNESYWGFRKPVLAEMRFKVITDSVASLVSYRNGDSDMMRPSSEQFVNMQETVSDWNERHASKQWVNVRSGYSFVAWQTGPRNGEKLTPFHDRRVRLAMTHLMDRQLIIDDITAGIGEVATGTNNRQSPFYNPEIEPWAYDMDRARELLAEAGWSDTDGDRVLENADGEEFEFEFTYSVGSDAVKRIVDYLKQQCAQVGIRMTERPIDWSIFTEVLNTRDFDAITFAWSASAPESDPRQIWHRESIQNQGDNFIQWDNVEASEIIDRLRQELDYDKRVELWHEFHRVLHEEQPYTFMRDSPWLRFVNRDFTNVNEYPMGLLYYEFVESLPMQGP